MRIIVGTRSGPKSDNERLKRRTFVSTNINWKLQSQCEHSDVCRFGTYAIMRKTLYEREKVAPHCLNNKTTVFNRITCAHKVVICNVLYLRSWMHSHLADSKLFVQMIDELPGKYSSNLNTAMKLITLVLMATLCDKTTGVCHHHYRVLYWNSIVTPDR